MSFDVNAEDPVKLVDSPQFGCAPQLVFDALPTDMQVAVIEVLEERRHAPRSMVFTSALGAALIAWVAWAGFLPAPSWIAPTFVVICAVDAVRAGFRWRAATKLVGQLRSTHPLLNVPQVPRDRRRLA